MRIPGQACHWIFLALVVPACVTLLFGDSCECSPVSSRKFKNNLKNTRPISARVSCSDERIYACDRSRTRLNDRPAWFFNECLFVVDKHGEKWFISHMNDTLRFVDWEMISKYFKWNWNIIYFMFYVHLPMWCLKLS